MLKNNPRTAGIPVIMLTAKVVLRIRAVQRRMEDTRTSTAAKQRRIHELVIDLDRHQVLNRKQEVDLTSTELKLLTLLVDAPGRVFTRDLLMHELWGDDYYAVDRTVDTHISRLSRKLDQLSGAIETMRGMGYHFRE